MASPFDFEECEEIDLLDAIGQALTPGPRVWCDDCAHSLPEIELASAITYRPENKVCPACYSEAWHILENDK